MMLKNGKIYTIIDANNLYSITTTGSIILYLNSRSGYYDVSCGETSTFDNGMATVRMIHHTSIPWSTANGQYDIHKDILHCFKINECTQEIMENMLILFVNKYPEYRAHYINNICSTIQETAAQIEIEELLW